MESTAALSSPASVQEKLERLRAILRSLGRVAVAFSGGVDSTFVLKVAVDTLGRENVLAVTGASDSVAVTEMDDARRLAIQIGAEHVVIETREFEDANYLANPTNRCYYCKTQLYTRMAELLAPRGPFVIVNGTNADDLGDFRPGLTAASEHSVRAPCADVGLTKSEIRTLSAQIGLPTADKPAAPCLSSRVQYGEAITPEKLRMIESGEAFLRSLGLRECRVRHHDKLARIEVPADQITGLAAPEVRAKIDAAFREIGYHYVTLDLRGFRSGSMNEVIAFGRRQP
ncbi:MAG TPA: ATP-dependent sacrificial sulfur transferase LarE [Phycisphaerae bacterium]|nr:ATP-dependent sacrificial sulfur transferase LarE [Phycisphaerae bacterium]